MTRKLTKRKVATRKFATLKKENRLRSRRKKKTPALKGKAGALVALKERKQRAKKEGRVNNASLPAGSAMYYYCYTCGLESDVRGEDDFSTVCHTCPACRNMKDMGWVE